LSLRNHSVFLISIATGEPSVRPWRTPPTSVSSSCSKRCAAPARSRGGGGPARLDLLDGDLEPGGQALDDDDEGLAVRLAGGEEAQHPGEATGGARPVRPRPPAHHGGIGPLARPQPLLERRLVDEHAEPVDVRAPAARRAQQPVSSGW
jgi:hypothetical protein